jgi:benzodiazapine receptor
MNKDTLRQITVGLSVIATIVVNGLANALPLNGVTTGEVSNRFDVYFVPAGYVFSIWGLIYAGLVAYAVYQALPTQKENPRLRRVGYLFVLSCGANIGWLFLWHYEQISLTLWPKVALLLLLIGIYQFLEIGRTQVSAAETWLVRAVFSVYLGWITVATIANATTVLYNAGWDGFGITPEAWAVIMLIAGAVITSAVTLTRGDMAYALVTLWAFVGISAKHTDVQVVMLTAWIVAYIVAIALVAGQYVQQRHRTQ